MASGFGWGAKFWAVFHPVQMVDLEIFRTLKLLVPVYRFGFVLYFTAFWPGVGPRSYRAMSTFSCMQGATFQHQRFLHQLT